MKEMCPLDTDKSEGNKKERETEADTHDEGGSDYSSGC